MSKLLFVACCALLAVWATGVIGDSPIYTTGDVQWMLMDDENGEPQLVLLSEQTSPKANVVLRENVSFILYTRENDATNGTRIYNDDVSTLDEFDARRDTKIMIHGFWGSLESRVIQATRRGWIDNGDDYNMIGVDYEVLVPMPNYIDAKRNALLVGPYVARLIDLLIEEKGATLSQFQLIGHSLGGQVIGMAAANVTSGKVARVSGMDPALPLFEEEDDINRLDPSDGVLVDVIHTDGGDLGFLTPIGHIDFYPNGGVHPQPGCQFDPSTQCSHVKCHQWYADSITNRDKYPARLCPDFESALVGDCAEEFTGMMGDNIGDTPHGIYYLEIPKDALP